MNRWVIVLLTVGLVTGCGDAAPPASGDGQPGTDRAASQASETSGSSESGSSQAEEAVYVDVRTPEEYAAGHVEGAINIPHTEMASRWRELEEYRDDRLVVYCRSGRRSGIAIDVLEERGFDDLTNAGGLSDLRRQGVPITR